MGMALQKADGAVCLCFWRNEGRVHPVGLHSQVKDQRLIYSRSNSRRSAVLPSADTAAMLFWALLASGQINMRKIDGWQTLATKPIDQQIGLTA
jgi:hypothetical protein